MNFILKSNVGVLREAYASTLTRFNNMVRNNVQISSIPAIQCILPSQRTVVYVLASDNIPLTNRIQQAVNAIGLCTFVQGVSFKNKFVICTSYLDQLQYNGYIEMLPLVTDTNQLSTISPCYTNLLMVDASIPQPQKPLINSQKSLPTNHSVVKAVAIEERKVEYNEEYIMSDNRLTNMDKRVLIAMLDGGMHTPDTLKPLVGDLEISTIVTALANVRKFGYTYRVPAELLGSSNLHMIPTVYTDERKKFKATVSEYFGDDEMLIDFLMQASEFETLVLTDTMLDILRLILIDGHTSVNTLYGMASKFSMTDVRFEKTFNKLLYWFDPKKLYDFYVKRGVNAIIVDVMKNLQGPTKTDMVAKYYGMTGADFRNEVYFFVEQHGKYNNSKGRKLLEGCTTLLDYIMFNGAKHLIKLDETNKSPEDTSNPYTTSNDFEGELIDITNFDETRKSLVLKSRNYSIIELDGKQLISTISSASYKAYLKNGESELNLDDKTLVQFLKLKDVCTGKSVTRTDIVNILKVGSKAVTKTISTLVDNNLLVKHTIGTNKPIYTLPLW